MPVQETVVQAGAVEATVVQGNAQQKFADLMQARAAKLKVTTTTRTPGGQIVDWVPIESQSDESIATAPEDLTPSGLQDARTPMRPVSLDEPASGPAGHVPIWRPDLSRRSASIKEARHFTSKGRRSGHTEGTPGLPNPAGYFHATSALFLTSFGCSAFLNVWRPRINLPDAPGDDHSISQFWLQYNAPSELLQSLEAGLTVDQNLNGDLNNHIFCFYTSNNYGNGNQSNNIGGYNALVSGWVQTHPTVFPGIAINGTSVRGGNQQEVGLKYQLVDGNWWLYFSTDSSKPWVPMGYYPASLFKGLGKSGNWVSFGGEVNSTLVNPCSTQDDMGSGVHASKGWTHAAYQRLLTNISDSSGTAVDYDGLPEVDTAAAACSKNTYTVDCFMKSDTNWKSYQYYGGPFNSIWTWSPQVELMDRASSSGPSLASNGALCMAWQGLGQNNIWVSVSHDSGTTWSAQQELLDRASSDAPALAVRNGQFLMAWRGLGQNNIWVATSANGLSWSSQTELGDRSTSAAPALAVLDGLVAMAWQGSGQSNLWVATSQDGTNWSGQVELGDRSSQFAPALAAGDGKFLMAWCGLGQNNIWVATSTDGINWSGQIELTDRSTSASPAIAYSHALKVFYMAWRGLNQNNIWVATSTDGVEWGPQVELMDRSTGGAPALCAIDETLYMAWQGSGQNNLWTSILTIG